MYIILQRGVQITTLLQQYYPPPPVDGSAVWGWVSSQSASSLSALLQYQGDFVEKTAAIFLSTSYILLIKSKEELLLFCGRRSFHQKEVIGGNLTKRNVSFKSQSLHLHFFLHLYQLRVIKWQTTINHCKQNDPSTEKIIHN